MQWNFLQVFNSTERCFTGTSSSFLPVQKTSLYPRKSSFQLFAILFLKVKVSNKMASLTGTEPAFFRLEVHSQIIEQNVDMRSLLQSSDFVSECLKQKCHKTKFLKLQHLWFIVWKQYWGVSLVVKNVQQEGTNESATIDLNIKGTSQDVNHRIIAPWTLGHLGF